MCTLILGRHVLGPGTLVVAGNRDEHPGRPSRGPDVLTRVPRVAGGRDALAGGTWMAVRERRAVVAILNRRMEAPTRHGTPRSRGLLAIDVAGVDEHHAGRVPLRTMVNLSVPLAKAALHLAWDAMDESRYAPLSLVFASPLACWVLTHDGGAGTPRVRSIPAGWHVLTHTDLDDANEPRTARLLEALSSWRPDDVPEARAGLRRLLALHADPSQPERSPAVCIHDGPMVTVSSFVVTLGPDEAGYHHLEGRPCEATLEDHSHLLSGAGVSLESA